MNKVVLWFLLLCVIIPVFSQTPLSFTLDGDVTDVYIGDIDEDGRQDYIFGTWNYLENPSLLYWWQFFWERGMIYFFSDGKGVFKYHTGAYINSVTTVDFGERLIAAGTTLLEGRPSGYVLFFDLRGKERNVFKTDGKVKKVYPLFGRTRLLILNYRELENETQFIVLGKNGVEQTFLVPDLIEEVLQTDLEGDGRLELIAGSVFDQDIPHYVYLFDQDYKELGHMETDDLVESLDAADIDGDGMKEIVVGTYNFVYAFRRDGSILWRYELPIGPVVAVKSFDISGDGSIEVIFTSQMGLFILNNSGQLVTQKDLPLRGLFLSSCDWDGDGKLEIMAGDGKTFSIFKDRDLFGAAEPPSQPPPITILPPQITASPHTAPPAQTMSPPPIQSPQATFFPAVIKLCGVNAVAEEITLCNNGAAPVDIGGWTLTDNTGSYTIPPGTIILATGSWTIDINTYNPNKNTKGIYLDDTSDFVELRDKNGNLVDKRTWGTPLILYEMRD
jgi:hypothetical protein